MQNKFLRLTKLFRKVQLNTFLTYKFKEHDRKDLMKAISQRNMLGGGGSRYFFKDLF